MFCLDEIPKYGAQSRSLSSLQHRRLMARHTIFLPKIQAKTAIELLCAGIKPIK